MKSNRTIVTAAALILFVVVMRVLPYTLIVSKNTETTPGPWFYPWNFSPLTATCLAFGALFGMRRGFAFIAALLMIFLSDLATGWAMGNMQAFAFHSLIPFTWGCTLFSAWMGTSLAVKRTVPRAIGAAAAAEIVFFLVTNAGNWWLMPTHPLTMTGLIQTYIDAIPFYGNQLIGTALYGSLYYILATVAEGLPARSAAAVNHGE